MDHPMVLAQRWGLTPHAALHLFCLLGVVPGVSVSSGRRTPERNRALGGVEGSFHLAGRAVDLVGSRAALEQAARTANAQRITPGCTGPEEVIDEGDHVHVAW